GKCEKIKKSVIATDVCLNKQRKNTKVRLKNNEFYKEENNE
ncbi:hypothetical protein GEW_12721, partial [Pasteurella multocida subsp. gallicida str. Anand1_poultry]